MSKPAPSASGMRTIKTTQWFYNSVLVAVTVICAATLTFVAFDAASSPPGYLLLLLFAAIATSQTLIFKSALTLDLRLKKFQRLARKLVQNKKIRHRDEKYALKILNHVNSIAGLPASHTCIWQKPLHGFSGDLALACESDCGKEYTLLADLTGHGIAAAMGAAPVASIFRATTARGLPLEEIVTELNNRLEQLLPSGFFCCAAVVLNDNGKLSVCNAGLPDILIANDRGELVDQVASEQLPLGIQATSEKQVCLFTKSYSAPHQLYAVTDGLIETVGANDEVFDINTLIRLIKTGNSDSRIGHITDHFESVAKGSTPDDDISIVEVMIC